MSQSFKPFAPNPYGATESGLAGERFGRDGELVPSPFEETTCMVALEWLYATARLNGWEIVLNDLRSKVRLRF